MKRKLCLLAAMLIAASSIELKAHSGDHTGLRVLTIGERTLAENEIGYVPVILQSAGEEEAFGFSVRFDPGELEFIEARLGIAAANAFLNVNASSLDDGRIGVALSMPIGAAFPLGNHEILQLGFKPRSGKRGVTAALRFGDSPIAQQVVSSGASELETFYHDGAVRIDPPKSGSNARVSGIVRYAGSGIPVAGARVRITGSVSRTLTTGPDGAYQTDLPRNGDYELRVTPPGENDPAMGISTLDITLIRRSILGLAYTESALQILAGDANRSKSLSTLDVTLVRRCLLGLEDEFPGGNWQFVPASWVPSDPVAPWEVSDELELRNLASDATEQDFIGLKLGDVNQSWTP